MKIEYTAIGAWDSGELILQRFVAQSGPMASQIVDCTLRSAGASVVVILGHPTFVDEEVFPKLPMAFIESVRGYLQVCKEAIEDSNLNQATKQGWYKSQQVAQDYLDWVSSDT